MGRDEITIREYERRQLMDLLPQAIELYEDSEVDDTAEELEAILPEFADEQDDAEQEYDLGADTWREISLALEEIGGSRAGWLSAKIGRRAELSAVRMGFSTSVPIGVLMTGKTPNREA